jgi:peptidylprolyl isomerase
VTYFNAFPTILRSRTGRGLATLGAAVLIAGCGSSGSSSTIGVGNENKGDEALAKVSARATSTPATPPAATVKTPATGPLSKKPTVSVPAGPAPTKLEIKDLIKGTGLEVKSPSSSVTVNYVGVLYKGGKEFDSSWKRGETATFSLSGVIQGWTKGIPGMKVGGRRELIIPAALAYGVKGSPPTIPPNAPLVFVIDLLGT